MKPIKNKDKGMDTAYLRARQKTEELKRFYFSLTQIMQKEVKNEPNYVH